LDRSFQSMLAKVPERVPEQEQEQELAPV